MKWIQSIIIAACLAFSLISVAEEPAQLINLNTATAEQLAALSGIGKAKAEAIVKYRDEHGGFKSIDELKEVKGVGDALLEKNRALIALE